MDDGARSLFKHQDTRPQDSAAPLHSDVAMIKNNYQQTAPAAKIACRPLVSR